LRRAAATAVLGVALSLVAAAFAITSLYVPGIGLALAGVAAATWVALASRGTRVVRLPGGATVEEGAPYTVEIRVRRARLAFALGELTDPLLERPLRRMRARCLRVESSFPRRGRRTLEPAVLTLRDPLHLAERRVRSDAHDVLVLPRVEPVAAEALAGGRGGTRESSRIASHDAALEFDSLRPYRLGAPASRIHWPTVARRGTMMERRLVADVDLRPLVVVDARNPDSSEALDRALRAAASLTVHLARAGGCALLLPGDRRPAAVDPDLRAWPTLHARLALVEDGGGPVVSRRLERAGAILWVTAGAAVPPPALGRAQATVRYLVAPAPLPGRAAAFEVAGCSAHELGRRARSAA
jgi:uncharacterized protein (DUF58 family)